jgi:hypothetical protein
VPWRQVREIGVDIELALDVVNADFHIVQGIFPVDLILHAFGEI